MKRKIISIFISFLFNLTLLITIFTLTVMNNNFVYKVMEKNNYYDKVYNNIINDIEKYDNNLIYTLEKEELIKDIKFYVKNRYSNQTIYSKIESVSNEKELEQIYNKNIKIKYFDNHNIRIIMYFIYLIDIAMIILCGIIFNKTKKKHDLSLIFIINLFITIVIYGVLYFTNINHELINIVVNSYNHYYLAYSIIFFEFGIYLIIKNRKNKLK